jgi:thermostable 8-oxoguanine DNA glycosylase
MTDFTQNIDYYIDQYDLEKTIFKLGKEIFKRGWLTKEEFLTICLWKSRRPKKLYDQNSNSDIINKTKLCLKENDELIKIKILTELKGVRIPTASALLSVTNPTDYPIIDERCIQSLNHLEQIKWTNITEQNWLEYLRIIRNLAKTHNKTAREVEKGLFAYNRIQLDKEYKNLYKQITNKS